MSQLPGVSPWEDVDGREGTSHFAMMCVWDGGVEGKEDCRCSPRVGPEEPHSKTTVHSLLLPSVTPLPTPASSPISHEKIIEKVETWP